MNAIRSSMDAHPRRHALSFAFALLLSSVAHAAGPLDFGYAVDGPPAVRPVLIFNDGTNTYVQPASGIPTTVKGAIQDGPYLRTPGLPHDLTVHAGRYAMQVTRMAPPDEIADQTTTQRRAAQPGGPVRPSPFDRPMGSASLAPLSSTDQRAVTGTPPALAADAPTSTTTVPQTPAGPSAAGLVAGPVVSTATPDAIEKAASAIAAKDAAAPTVTAQLSSPSITSPLSRSFGALAIRDSDATHTEIRFASRPTKDLAFMSADGHALHPVWDTATNVVSLDRAAQFVVSDGTTTVEVARVATSDYAFDSDNKARLQTVFSKDGATFFKFSGPVKHVTVVDVNHAGTGKQKGRFYKFNGTADQFIVTANGSSTNVTRKTAVTYYDRAAKQS